MVKSMSALLSQLRGHEKWVLPGLFCLLLTNVFGVLPPQIIRQLMDAVGSKPGSGLGMLLLALLGATLARGITMYWMRQTLIVMSRRCEQSLKDKLFAQILAMSPSRVKEYASGDLISRMTEDVGKIRMFLGPGLMYSLNLLVLFIMVIGVMLRVSPQLTLWVLTPLPFLVLGIYLLNLKILSRSAAIQAHLGRMTAFVQ
ncbi:MAG: ABC transporter ATP-binding protein, partial [Cytophagia bacterium]|nr:ABC transporter ATP-binding protein [Cytophagia bacterium]